MHFECQADASLSCHTRNVSQSTSRSSSGRSPKPSNAGRNIRRHSRSNVSAGYPEDDLQKHRSEHALMIEVLVSSGTEKDRKRSPLSALVTRLQAAGTDPNDVMVFFGEIDRASGSFGGGRPALPVEVRP
jgi:hypothetical protein